MPAEVSKLPDPKVCEQARLSRDPRFDGLFFTAVTSTGIYCRPVCPVRAPKRENIRYYPTAAAAEADGFRPCLRCRPELSPGDWSRGDATVARALKLIEDGFLAEDPLPALAARVGVGERHLRRLFVERLGATPPSVHRTRRLLFAKQLLTETSLPIIDVALEAGFGSLRRFNACFRDSYGLAPRDLRRTPRRPRARQEVLELRLGYRPPYDFAAQLDFLRPRSLPGLEVVDERGYARAFGRRDAPGWLRVGPWPGAGHALRLEVHCREPRRIQGIVTRVRRMFDLDADPATIAEALAQDARLRRSIEREPGLRLPGGWDGFETAVRTVLERHAGVAAARTASAALLERWGERLDASQVPGLDRIFPSPEMVAGADLETAGLQPDSAASVRAIARAVLDGRVDFGPERTLEEFVARWSALPGVDRPSAHEIAMRALGCPDAFPAGDPLPRRTEDAKRWRPWRAYAAIRLWRDAACGGRWWSSAA